MPDRALLLAHTAATLAMFGMMWSIQVVVYPQFRNVGTAEFVAYAERHSKRVVAALAPLAPIEVVTALLVWLTAPGGVSRTVAFVAGTLLAVGWISTGAYFAPLHGRLQSGGRDDAMVERLIATNRLRTALWAVRAALAIQLAATGL